MGDDTTFMLLIRRLISNRIRPVQVAQMPIIRLKGNERLSQRQFSVPRDEIGISQANRDSSPYTSSRKSL